MFIGQETVIDMNNGWTNVGTTAIQLTTNNLPEGLKKGVLLQTPGPDDDAPNTNPVYVSIHSNVTADNDPGTGGFPLAPGKSVVLPVRDATKVWIISSAASQNIAWVLL